VTGTAGRFQRPLPFRLFDIVDRFVGRRL